MIAVVLEFRRILPGAVGFSGGETLFSTRGAVTAAGSGRAELWGRKWGNITPLAVPIAGVFGAYAWGGGACCA